MLPRPTNPLRRAWRRGCNEVRRQWYRQRVRWGLLPQREELSGELYNSLRSVCVFLGPYRNLTTLTAAILSLHPKCQVLNHSGFRILEDPRLNVFDEYSESRFRKFLCYLMKESQGGTRGDDGGSITLSHAFKHDRLRQTYEQRFGDATIKPTIACLVWKESLAVSNYLRGRDTPIAELLERNDRLRFLMPIRNPLDCAVSNYRTGHAKRFRSVAAGDIASVLTAVVDEIAWFRQLALAHPSRFLSIHQHEVDARRWAELAEFLNLEADTQWIRDAQDCFQVKSSYEHAADLVSHYERLISRHFSADPEFSDQLARFLPSRAGRP